MKLHAAGSFEVKLTPVPPAGGFPARMAIEKRYRGDLEAAATGEMLAHTTDVKGSAGYVAMERVTGSLHGRAGSFVLQHHGIMTRGAPALAIVVVPDSATGELAGLSGSLAIRIENGAHFYAADFELPEA